MTEEFSVTGMTCGHCARAVTAAIRARDPAAEVDIALESGRVRTVSSLSRAQLAAAIAGEGYQVAG